MLDVGFSEILLTSAIALIVLGPERLPKVARQVGNWMGRARLMARQLSEQLEREVSAEELLKIQNKPNPTAGDAAKPPPSGSAIDSAYAGIGAQAAGGTQGTGPPSIALPGVTTPGAATLESDAPQAAAPVVAPPGSPVEPVYGLDASATTPAAMHGTDTKPAP